MINQVYTVDFGELARARISDDISGHVFGHGMKYLPMAIPRGTGISSLAWSQDAHGFFGTIYSS